MILRRVFSTGASLFFGCVLFSGPARAQKAGRTDVLTNRSIVTLADAGFDEQFIVDLILRSRCQFDMSADGMASLAKLGVNQHVIRVMLDPEDAQAAKTGGHPGLQASRTAPAASAAISAPEPQARRRRPVVIKPKPLEVAIATHTPYYETTRFMWLFHRQVGVGAPADSGEETVGSQLGEMYQRALRAH